ncbi:hypothetical protein [Pseudoruegeria sp. SHC-113]|uniref:hypothetical protein n=1 Tax=Pseudoruegeria sp. SHC-113 TaxID=2855439 RepID=UPI0021BB6323|nr:hypothetical protein [Pseudoruegeria sp. SHC-113]MCT8159996.1 hypothetical protein [Pseudoruegeria sp. SHC-113]
MKMEVKKILDRIGYAEAVFYHSSLFPLFSVSSEKEMARLEKGAVKDALTRLKAVQKAINNLPEFALEGWSAGSRSSKDWYEGRDTLPEVLGSLADLIEEYQRYIDDPFEDRGRARSWAADEIAFQMACIFVLGRGCMPDGKARGENGNPTGQFTRAVSDMLRELKIRVGFRKPCERAVERLDGSETFRALMQEREMRGRRQVSLFDLRPADKSGGKN